MKKSLAIALALVFALSVVGTALAAPANPFVDVPAKHWAYDAVNKLAKAGIVDGYGDGTFRGDRTMTRYEMAQIVAKAMARSDKANAENKALIDKLAVEFAAELNNLGVRVAKLEAKTNIKWGMENRLRFITNSPPFSDQKIKGADAFEWRVRFHVNADVNPDTTFTARIEATGTKIGMTGPYVKSVPGTVETNNGLKINRAFFTTKNFLGLDEIKYGRMGLYYGQTLLVGKSSNNDAIAISHKMGDVTFKGFYSVINPDPGFPAFYDYPAIAPATWNSQEFGYYGLYFSPDKNLDFNLAYWTNNQYVVDVVDYAGYNKSSGWDLGFATKFGDWTFIGEYVKASLDQVGWAPSNDPKAWAFQISNGVNNPKIFYPSQLFIVNAMKPGTDAWALSYRSIDRFAIPTGLSGFEGVAPGVNAAGVADNVKGYFLTYENVLAKGVVLSLEYQDLKTKTAQMIGSASDHRWFNSGASKDKTFLASLQFVF